MGSVAAIFGSSSFTPLTTDSVDAPPCLNIVSSAERFPLVRTMFVCTRYPSRTCATSRM